MPDVVGSHFQGKPVATNPWDAQGDGKGHCVESHAVWIALCAPGAEQYLLEMPAGRSACAPQAPRDRCRCSLSAFWAGALARCILGRSPWKGVVGLQTPHPRSCPAPAELLTAHSRLRPPRSSAAWHPPSPLERGSPRPTLSQCLHLGGQSSDEIAAP